jgi:hypothetical protein
LVEAFDFAAGLRVVGVGVVEGDAQAAQLRHDDDPLRLVPSCAGIAPR